MSDTSANFRRESRLAPYEAEGLLVDLNTGALRHNHVLVQRTPGVEIFIGLGSGAGRALDFAFERKFEAGSFLAHCDAIDRAIETGDLMRAQQLGIDADIAAIAPPHLRRLALLETLLGKASVDDPVHPGWPAGAEGSLGGKFRPKNTSAAAREATQQKLRRLEARKEFKIAASAALKLGATMALNLVPGVGEVADAEEFIELGRTAIELGNAEYEVNAAIDFVKKGPYELEDLMPSRELETFSSFDDFKKISTIEELIKRFGSAGFGSEYHHIVEQGGDNETNIPPEMLHSTVDIVKLPTLLHELVSAEYSKKSPQDSTKTVRAWLQTQPFDVQWREGVKILQDLGIVRKGDGP